MTSSLRSFLSNLRTSSLRAVAFWGLLIVATGFLIWPVWVGPMPPMTDIGGHVANADIWARYDEVELYREMFVLRTGISPNTLSARFVSWLYPLVDIITGIRLYITLMMLATVAAFIGVTHAFGRSRWAVFLAVPFLWNTGMHWGMVNFVAFFPFFFAAIIFARHAGESGEWRWGLALGVTTAVSFFAHGLGPPLAVGAATFVLVCSLTRPAHLIHLITMLPAVVIWFWWKAGASGKHGVPGDSLWEMLTEHSTWHPPLKKIEVLVEHAFNATTTNVEYFILAGLIGLFILAMTISKPAPQQEGSRARRHTLLWTVLCLWIAVWVFPSYYGYTNIATRVCAAFLMAAALLPRLDRKAPLTYVIAVASVSICVGFGLFVGQTFEQFQRQNLRPIDRLSSHVEPQSRVECFGLPGYMNSRIIVSPLRNNCVGLVQVRTGSFGGTSFAHNPFNPVGFRRGYEYKGIENHGLDNIGYLQMWDYLLTDGPYPKPPTDLTNLVATETSPGDEAPVWNLYRVESFETDWTHKATTDAKSGAPFTWRCPTGHALAGYRGRHTGGGAVSSLRPVCRPLKAADNGNGPTVGPRIGKVGSAEKTFAHMCPQGTHTVGLEVAADSPVRDLAIRCAPVSDSGWSEADSQLVGEVDATKSNATRTAFSCPPDSVVTGAIGRNGMHVDALGIGCESIRSVTEGQQN